MSWALILAVALALFFGAMRAPRRARTPRGFGEAIPCPIHQGCIVLSTGNHIRRRRERFAGLEQW